MNTRLSNNWQIAELECYKWHGTNQDGSHIMPITTENFLRVFLVMLVIIIVIYVYLD